MIRKAIANLARSGKPAAAAVSGFGGVTVMRED
jgi:hypothetical protein